MGQREKEESQVPDSASRWVGGGEIGIQGEGWIPRVWGRWTARGVVWVAPGVMGTLIQSAHPPRPGSSLLFL